MICNVMIDAPEHDIIQEITDNAAAHGRDFYKLYAAVCLWIPYEEVTDHDRMCAKNLLFAWTYRHFIKAVEQYPGSAKFGSF